MTLEDRQPSADPGALLATTHDVGDGMRVRLRLTRPSDAPRIREFLGDDAAPEEIHRFAFYDARTRRVIAATAFIDRREQIVGLADCGDLEVHAADDLRGHRVRRLLLLAATSLGARPAA